MLFRRRYLVAAYTEILYKYFNNVQRHYDNRPSEINIPRKQQKKLINKLKSLNKDYKDDFYYQLCLSDTFALFGYYRDALEHCPKPEPYQKWSLLASKRLNLKHILNDKCNAAEILCLYPKKITKYGKEHMNDVLIEMDKLLLEWETNHDTHLLKYITKKYSQYKRAPMYFYNGTMFGHDYTKEKVFDFNNIIEFEDITRSLTREAEDMVREKNGRPKVGEGWISETDLYYKVKEHLPDYEVIQHGKPKWLKRQHLDVYVPALKLGIEYQGLQHDKPVDFFGGEDAFKRNKERDKRKFNLCKRHGVKIIYVREGYDFNEVLDLINERIKL